MNVQSEGTIYNPQNVQYTHLTLECTMYSLDLSMYSMSPLSTTCSEDEKRVRDPVGCSNAALWPVELSSIVTYCESVWAWSMSGVLLRKLCSRFDMRVRMTPETGEDSSDRTSSSDTWKFKHKDTRYFDSHNVPINHPR